MYKITILETAQELLDAFTEKDEGGNSVMPIEVYVVFDGNNYVGLSGMKNLPFSVSDDVKQSDVIEELFERAGVRIHIT